MTEAVSWRGCFNGFLRIGRPHDHSAFTHTSLTFFNSYDNISQIPYKLTHFAIFHTSPAYRPSYRNLSTITIHKPANQTPDLFTIKNKVIHNIKFSRHIINMNNDKFLAL